MYLIYGGAGYIGLNIVISLLRTTMSDIIIIDNFVNSFNPIDNGCIESEYRDRIILNPKDVRQYKISVVIFLAGHKSVAESVKDPLEYYRNNINIFIDALEVFTDSGCFTFICSSSAAVYGEHKQIFVETDDRKPVCPYGNVKLSCEYMLEDFSKRHPDKTFFMLRYFNPYGGFEKPRKEEYLNITPKLYQCVEKNVPFKINGTTYNTRDGTCVRDFIHISDIVDAHVLCINIKPPSNYNVYNIGSGTGTTIKEFVEAFKKIHPNLRVEYGAKRDGDSECLVSNATKIKKELGWEPKIKDIKFD